MLGTFATLSFYALVAGRFFYPFFNSPLTHLSGGLSGRQWEQAGLFFTPPEMSGIDAFLYQPWLAFVRYISWDEPLIVNAFCGLLCAALPVCWYYCARQLLPKQWALVSGIIIAACPSLLTIYAYFTSETLLLPMMGLACALTATCWKRPSQILLILAIAVWITCAFTRMLAIPPAFICVVALLWRCNWPLKAAALAALWLGIVGGAASWHSQLSVQVYSPFGLTHLNAAMARSQTTRVYYSTDEAKNSWFRSPALSTRLFEPFSDWRINDQKAPIYLNIKTSDGYAAWNSTLDPYPITADLFIRQVGLNTLFLLFGPSWPEVWPHNWKIEGEYIPWESNINHWWRWVWAPMIIMVTAGVWRAKLPALHHGFLSLTLMLCVLLCFQFSGVLEGRYRKPIEPMLIISCLSMLYYQRQSGKKRYDHA